MPVYLRPTPTLAAANAPPTGFNFDPAAIFSSLYNKVEIRTALSSPVTVDLSGPSQVSPLIQKIKPAIIFTGPAGRFQIAPAGVPEGVSAEGVQLTQQLGFGLAAGAIGLLVVGAALGKALF